MLTISFGDLRSVVGIVSFVGLRSVVGFASFTCLRGIDGIVQYRRYDSLRFGHHGRLDQLLLRYALVDDHERPTVRNRESVGMNLTQRHTGTGRRRRPHDRTRLARDIEPAHRKIRTSRFRAAAAHNPNPSNAIEQSTSV